MVCVLGVEIKDTMQTNARRDQRKSVTLLDHILLTRRNLHLKSSHETRNTEITKEKKEKDTLLDVRIQNLQK